MPYFSPSEEATNILPAITNGDYADDINYHYFQLLHPARPCRLRGQLPVEEPPPAAAVHSLAEPSDCESLFFSISVFFYFLFLLAFVLSVLFFYILSLPLAGVNESRYRQGHWMNEVRCKLIVARSDMNWGGNPWHRLYRFSFSLSPLNPPSPPRSYLILLLFHSHLCFSSCRCSLD